MLLTLFKTLLGKGLPLSLVGVLRFPEAHDTDQGQRQSFAQQCFEQRQQHRGGRTGSRTDAQLCKLLSGRPRHPDSELDAYI